MKAPVKILLMLILIAIFGYGALERTILIKFILLIREVVFQKVAHIYIGM
jgi:hypothetical protein